MNRRLATSPDHVIPPSLMGHVAENGRITRAALPLEIGKHPVPLPEPSIDDLGELPYRDAIQKLRTDGVRRYLEAVLRRFGGHVTAAADHADLERESFYRLCRQHNVNPNDFRTGAGESEPSPPRSS